MLTDEHHTVNRMIDRGAAFDRIEDYINTLTLPGEQLSAPTPAPQSKPVTQASRLVAQGIAPLVAFGLGPRILSAGPASHRHYSY